MLEVNKFMMNGEKIDFQDAEARTEINEQVSRLDDKIDNEAIRLDNRIDSKPDIDDASVSTADTWSSSKIETEIQGAGGGAKIDDNDISASKVWSSQKTNSEIQNNAIEPNDIIEPLQKAGIEVFTSDGTFTVPNGITNVFVTMYDGGGAGGKGGAGGGVAGDSGGKGGGANGGSGGVGATYGVGGGGGAGGYTIQKPLSVIAGEEYDIVVGMGGSTSGETGGTSSISLNGVTVLLTDKQGANGSDGNNSTASAGGAGGSYGAGAGGGGGYTTGGSGGAGSSYGLGGTGGKGDSSGLGGRDGGAYGAGGGGGYSTIGAGGKGAQGIVVITWGDVYNIVDFKNFFASKV